MCCVPCRSQFCQLLTAGAVAGCLAYGVLVWSQAVCTCLNLLSFLSLLASVKLMTSVVKYTPQACAAACRLTGCLSKTVCLNQPACHSTQIRLHHVTKSTAGWSVENCLLDLAGGLLSLGQLLGDAFVLNSWSDVIGDPVKFGLGFVSIIADIVIMVGGCAGWCA
jgi:cystinosin